MELNHAVIGTHPEVQAWDVDAMLDYHNTWLDEDWSKRFALVAEHFYGLTFDEGTTYLAMIDSFCAAEQHVMVH
jgi:hypothetical protein